MGVKFNRVSIGSFGEQRNPEIVGWYCIGEARINEPDLERGCREWLYRMSLANAFKVSMAGGESGYVDEDVWCIMSALEEE